ncbi:hypothetical protein LTR66_017083, partial [Elasticomyces elasticus]
MQDVAYENKDRYPGRPWYFQNGEKVSKNIIDYLKFEVAENMREDYLSRYHKQYTESFEGYGQDLTRLMDDEMARLQQSSGPQRANLYAVLTDLQTCIKKIRDRWSLMIGKKEDEERVLDFSRRVEELTEDLYSIEPLDRDCDIRYDFVREGGGSGSRWSLLRASCTYREFKKSKLAM